MRSNAFFLFLLALGFGACDPPPPDGAVEAGSMAQAESGGTHSDADQGSRPFARLVLESAFPVPFNYLSGVRELPGGELLAADPLGVVLLRVNLETGRADTLGRVGEGPQEYRQPDQVFPLPGDSTLLVDLGKGRLITVDPTGHFGNALPIVLPTEAGFPTLLLPSFVDGAGHVYFQGARARGAGAASDSVPIVRLHRGTGATERVVALWVPATQTRSRRGQGFLPRMLEAADGWAVGADGGVAVVRADGYRVEWHLPDGGVTLGPATPYERSPVGAAEKAVALEEAVAGGMTMVSAASPSGVTSMQMRRGLPQRGEDGPGVDDFEWAETLPPFRPEGIHVSPEGEAWVERMLPASHPPRMDVFDGRGVRVGWVELPARTRLIGFGMGRGGSRAAYLVRTDEVGLKWLGRYLVLLE